MCSLNDPESGRNGFVFIMYWLSSLPLDGVDPSPEATWIQLQNATQRNQYSENCEFRLPQMKVGTLDSLLNLSDDLAKVNAAVESTVNKLRRQLYDVAEDDEDIVEITVEGVRPEVRCRRCRRRWWWWWMWWMCSHVLSHSLTHSLTLSLLFQVYLRNWTYVILTRRRRGWRPPFSNRFSHPPVTIPS